MTQGFCATHDEFLRSPLGAPDTLVRSIKILILLLKNCSTHVAMRANAVLGAHARSHLKDAIKQEMVSKAVKNPRAPQYRFAIGNSSAGKSVITRQPLSVTTTSSSMRAAE